MIDSYFRISSIQKQLKSCEGVIADIEKFQTKIRKRKEFSRINSGFNSEQGNYLMSVPLYSLYLSVKDTKLNFFIFSKTMS